MVAKKTSPTAAAPLDPTVRSNAWLGGGGGAVVAADRAPHDG
jgi:hypothetical protein